MTLSSCNQIENVSLTLPSISFRLEARNLGVHVITVELGRVLANSFNITGRMLENVTCYIIPTIRFVKPKSLTAIFRNWRERIENCDRITMVICSFNGKSQVIRVSLEISRM